MVPEEAPKRMRQSSLTIELRRSEPGRLNAMDINTLNGGKIKAPGGTVLLSDSSNTLSVMDIKVRPN